MAPAKKLDYKKEFPKLYKPSHKNPVITDIPKMKFFMIDGSGDPNTAQEYKDAVKTLYKCSYLLKMKIVKKSSPSKDYVVPPLEGLWYMDRMEDFSMNNKDDWKWTMMIRIPDFVTEKQIEKAIGLAKQNGDAISISKIRIEEYDEGLTVQILYFGPYDDEPPTIQRLHKYAEEEGYELDGFHHEIYLSDPRRTKPEKLKTILRQPIKRK